MLWITLEGKPYYWDGDRFRKPLAYDLAFTQWTDTFFGGDDRELYASQHGEQDKNEGKIYRLHDGRIDPVCDFDYDTSVERPGLHVMKSGLLLNWGEKFIEVYAKGRWNRTEASLSTGRTKLVEVGDRVCLLYFDHLYVIAPDGKVSAAKHYLDDPSIASNKTRGEYWKSFVSTKLNAAAWGKDRLLLMAPGLTGYDLAAGKLINVGWIEARVHAGGVYAHLFTDRQGAAWIGVDERWWEGRGIFYRVTPEGEIRREAGTSAFAVEAVYDLRDPLIASDGSLWFVLARGRVARYRDGRAEIMGPSNGIRGPVHSLLEGRNGEVFATTDYGLFVYDPKRPPAPLPRLTDHWDEFTLLFWTNPIRDSEGNLWALRADRPGEISRWDGRAWRHQHVPFDAAKISCSMADDRGHVLLGKVDVRVSTLSPAGVTTYTDFRDALVAAIARGARRFQPSRCVAVDGGKKLCAHFYTGQDIACYDGKQWSGRHFNEWISSLHESPKYGVLIQGGGQYYAWDGGQIRHVDTAHATRWLWGENGYQPYEAALLQAIRSNICRSSWRVARCGRGSSASLWNQQPPTARSGQQRGRLPCEASTSGTSGGPATAGFPEGTAKDTGPPGIRTCCTASSPIRSSSAGWTRVRWRGWVVRFVRLSKTGTITSGSVSRSGIIGPDRS